MYALNLIDGNRVASSTLAIYNPSGVMVDYLPEGNIYDYRYKEGGFVYDPIPKPIKPEPDPGEQYVTFNDLDKALSKGVNSI